VDGYAVVAADTSGAGETLPVFLRLAGSVAMGEGASLRVHRGECAYVPTGAMIPPGADAVVMVEYCENTGTGTIGVCESLAPGSGLVEPGEDCRAGQGLLSRGCLIRPQEAGALAAAGLTKVPVYPPRTLSLLSTGDELIPPEGEPGPGQIRDINSTALAALAEKNGYRVVLRRIIPDEEALLMEAVRGAVKVSDVVVLSGGSSQGDRDWTGAVFSRLARPGILCHGLALKPGKPTLIAWDEATQTLLMGLPGHPVSAMMVFTLLLSWLSRTLAQAPEPFPIPARISSNLPGSPGKTLCQPVHLRREAGGYLADPVFGKSGMITTLIRADGFILIDKNREGLKKEEEVWVHLF
jgi:molybdopterin molybdotransferase